MNRYGAILGLWVFTASLQATAGVVPYGYHSLGVDTYASGESVRDGECYAFVWVRNGYDFAGYRRDGSLVDGINNEQVYVRALARDGRCPPVNFLLSEAFAKAHADGSYQVIVLDTRCANGTPATLGAANALWRVNGWGVAQVQRDEATQASVSATLPTGAAADAELDEDAALGSRVDHVAALPPLCRKPVITGISVDAAGNAVVAFSGTERYLSYRLAAGETMARVGEILGQDCCDGSEAADAVQRLTLGSDEFEGAKTVLIRVDADLGLGEVAL